MTWDLPADAEKLQVYLNKARNDWLPSMQSHRGVQDIAMYRNPLESSPQSLLVITFADLQSWQEYVGSRDNERISLELRSIGCTGIVTRVWIPSSLTPEPLHGSGTGPPTYFAGSGEAGQQRPSTEPGPSKPMQ
jgi:hypothetical protein